MGKFFDALQKAASKNQEHKTKPKAGPEPSLEQENQRVTAREQPAPPLEQERRRVTAREQPAPSLEQEHRRVTARKRTAPSPGKESGRTATEAEPAPTLEQVPSVDHKAIDSLRLEPVLQESCAATSPSLQSHILDELLITCSPDGNQQFKFAAEQFKMLRSHLLFPADRSSPRTIMVTSAIPGEGKSIVAGNLAVSIALGKQEHVLLMECDLRRPSLCNVFGLGHRRGLSDYLLEEAELSDLLCKTEVDKLTILPGGTMTETPYELLSSQRMMELLKEVKNRYEDRYIILDSTPAQVAAETGVLSKFVDGIVMVVRYGRSSRKVVRETMERIGEDKFLGVVFNCMEGTFVNEYYYKYYGGDLKKTSRISKWKSSR